MGINEIRKNIIETSSDEYIEEISNFLFDGNLIGKDIEDIRDLFASSPSNKEKRDEEDFKYFYDRVAFVDFCEYNNLAKTKLSAKKYLAAAFNVKTYEFSYNSNKFYKDGNTPLDTMLVLNVKGKNIYKVLTAVYTSLRDNGVDNCITIPSFNRFEEGLTDSVRISINAADMERVVGLIDNLPIKDLINEPSMLYPKINNYIGYDSLVSENGLNEVRQSSLVSKSISDALSKTITYFLDNNGNELIENDGESISKFRESVLANNQSLIEADLKILQRMIAIDPSNKSIFTENLKETLLGNSMTKSAYITPEVHSMFDEIYGKLDDDSILFNKENMEFSIQPPNVEIEGEPNLEQVPMVAPSNELLVQEEQSKELLVPEEQSKDLLVPEEQSKELLVTEQNQDTKKEESLYESFMNRTGSSEEYLDSLLAGVTKDLEETTSAVEEPVVESAPQVMEEPVVESAPQVVEEPVVESAPQVVEEPVVESAPQVMEEPIVESAPQVVEEPVVESAPQVVEEPQYDENVHFYESAANVGENFVVSSTPAEAAPVENNSQVNEESELVKPEDMTDEQKKLVSDTYDELQTKDGNLLEYFEDILNKFPDTDLSEGHAEHEEQSIEGDLNAQEIQSLSNNPLDEQMNNERALKYKDLVNNISILNTKVKGTDFTLLDYFDQQQLLSKIKPEASYMTFTDEVYNGLGIVENCVIKYVSHYGNVPLDKIIEEYGIQELVPIVEQEKPRGLKALFQRKRS